MITNLITVIYMLIMLAIVIISNTVLGIVIANKKKKFSWKKLFTGMAKAIIIALCLLAFCITLELIPTILGRINIEIPTDLITVAEIILMTLTAYKKYATDCIDKFKTVLGIKEGE